MSSSTSKYSYRDHKYSGKRKSRARVRPGFKCYHHGEDLSYEVIWRKKRKVNSSEDAMNKDMPCSSYEVIWRKKRKVNSSEDAMNKDMPCSSRKTSTAEHRPPPRISNMNGPAPLASTGAQQPSPGKYTGDLFKLDTENKTPEQNIVEIIQGLYLRKPAHNDVSPTSKGPAEARLGLRGMPRNNSDSRRLSYLNALVTLLSKEDRNNLGFTVDELMTCIRISLVDDSMVIRAAALRVLRYLIKTESDVAAFNTLKLSYLVIRSMDLMLRNEEERAQALRVVRRIIAVAGGTGQQRRRHRAAHVEHGLLRCLAAVARAGSAGDGSGDRLARPAIATLAEIGVLNPELFIACGGVNAVTRQLAECATPRMAEALCGVLLHMVNNPAARIDLTCLSAPYCDFHTRPVASDSNSNRDEREMRFTCSRLALLCVLRSWPGLLHFCHPKNAGGLKALVQALYLPRLEVRKAILDLLYELVGLPQPEWTDEISVALDAVDPSDFQDSWRLNEGFVAAEGTSILPHLSATGPDITEIHLALLLQCFLEAGLLDGLAEVIVTSDTFISVRATVLLGQLLHLLHLLLPPQICSITPALPSLLGQASEGRPQALAAVAALRRLHAMLEARPASSSLFLDHIIQYCSGAFREKEDYTKSRKEKDNASMAKPALQKENSVEFLNESDNEGEPKQRHSVGSRADLPARNLSALVKSNSFSSKTSAAFSKITKTAKFFGCTLVMQNKDGNSWNWEIIRTILKENDSTPLLNLNDSGHKAWVGRIVNYLKPSSNKYSHTDLTSSCHGHAATRAGCQLIRHLLRHNDVDSQRLLEELFSDVSRQIEAIETGLKAHECLFSPQHMCTTMCQMYFLFVGQLCHSHAGLRLFKQTRLYENLLELAAKTHHSCYVKLIISSLDYTLDSYPRDILAKTLTCSIQASRLYATQFLNVLLRASRKSREMVRRKTKLKKNLADLKPHKMQEANGVDMESWILHMLVGQLKDECRAVVKCALSILEEAYSVPALVEKMLPLKDSFCQNCRLDKNAEPSTLDFSAVGDRGYLLWLGLEVAYAAQSPDAKTTAFLKKHLDFWNKNYNYRYVRLVEAAAQEALALCGGGGRRGRSRRAARLPPHLLAARLPPHLLQPCLPPHYKILQRKKCANEQEIMDLKASLWAVGNTAVSSQGLQQLMNLTNGYMEDSVPVHVVRLVKFCSVYSVRATAFYVLSLIGSTYEGANLLSDLGWLCVRHTRHDTFPVIPDESYLDANLASYIASPERRYNASNDPSEHSDLTDQSILETLTYDYPKLNKTGSISADDNHDVVDHKTSSEKRDLSLEKKKSHTLPTQGGPALHDRPTLSESRTVDILRDCSIYERQVPHSRENRLLFGRLNSMEHAHEGRVRNTSESSTSGVSSCDSFLGRYVMPDRVTLTLSPIPSSSSLYGMKSSSSTQRPRLADIQRRTSTSSFSTQEVASSPPSQMDMTGYDTLKSLNRHRRPHLSESAATGSSDLDDICWLLTDNNRRSRPFSSLRDRAKSTRERMTKLSLLDYDWKPLGPGRETRAGSTAGQRAPPPPALRPPAYIGICLPQDLMDLFPREEETKEEVGDRDTKRGRVPSFAADCSMASAEHRSRATPDSQKLASYRSGDVTRSAANFITSSMGAGPSMITGRTTSFTATVKEAANFASDGSSAMVNTSSTNITSTSKVSDAGDSDKASKSGSHNIDTAETDSKTTDRKSETKVTKSDLNNAATDVVDSAGNEGNIKAQASELVESTAASDTGTNSTIASGVKTNASDNSAGLKCAQSDVGTNSTVPSGVKNASVSETSVAKAVGGSETGAGWRHARGDCLACVPTRPPSAHELREAFFAGIECSIEGRNAPSPVSEHSPQAEVMHQAHFMANPIHLRQTRAALLSLKQRHPEVFRSACVYSDVCGLLSRDTYMLCARRFLQELFLDANMECFAAEPAAILARHASAMASPQPPAT